jgi:hypothetical protein
MPKPTIKLPFPLGFYTQVSIDVYKNMFGNITLVPYDANDIDTVIKHEDTRADIFRTLWKFSNDTADKGKSYGDDALVANEYEDIYSLMQIDAKLYGLGDLSREDIRALIALNCSVDKTFLQGGIFQIASLFFKEFLNHLGLTYSQRNVDELLQVSLDQNNNLLITKSTAAAELFDYKAEDGRTLIKQDNAFSLVSSDGVYTLAPHQDNNVEFDAEFYQEYVMPRASKKLAAATKLEALHLFMFVPFLADENFRKQFDKKLQSQSDEFKETARYYIGLCFANDVELRNNITEALKLAEFPVETVSPEQSDKPAEQTEDVVEETHSTEPTQLQVEVGDLVKLTVDDLYKNAQDELISVVSNTSYPEAQRDNGGQILAAIANLSDAEKKKNLLLLTKVMNGAANVIKSPTEENINAYQALMVPVINNKWRKLAIGMAAIVLSAAIITISTAIAVASFGATSLLSAWGIYVGTSLLVKAISITAGAVGLGMIAGGMILANDRSLKKVTAATSMFWQPAKVEGPAKPNPEISSRPQVSPI